MKSSMKTWAARSVVMMSIAGAASAQEFRGLGFLEDPDDFPRTSSEVYGLSRDGRFAVGRAATSSGGFWGIGGRFAVRWEAPFDGNPLALADTLGGEVSGRSAAWAAADNGDAAGFMELPGTNSNPGVLWPSDGSATGTGFLSGTREAGAYGISSDGAVTVGEATDSLGRRRATRSVGGIASSLGTLFGDPAAESSFAFATDRAGAVIVGEVVPDAADNRPFWWTEAEGMQEVPALPNSLPAGSATAVSADGRFVAGSAAGNDGWSHGFIYDRVTGVLTDTGSGPQSDAIVYGVNADATVLVGQVFISPRGAGIWRKGDGWRGLEDVLTDEYGLGAALDGWLLTDARAVSDDGLTIVGNGIDPDGRSQGWVAILAPACPADFDGDGAVDSLDVLAFLNSWTAGEDRADFNGDGQINTLDFLDFLNAWNAGCV